jgi:xanthine dehydrogenase accessory factor
MSKAQTFAAFVAYAFEHGEKVARISVLEAEGSTPRDNDALMMVSESRMIGTIGGGRLEFDAVTSARNVLKNNENHKRQVITLGPEIGQCCGGRMTVAIERILDIAAAKAADAEVENERARCPVYVFGAGHVGVALARALAPLPLSVKLIDTRPDIFEGVAIEGVQCIQTERPLELVDQAPAGSSFVVLTHSHALDSRIAAEVLELGDFTYLGIIGSKTKRRVFEKAFRAIGIPQERITRIVCPIGGDQTKDKRPAVIAALVAAELLVVQATAARNAHKQSEAA